MLIGVDIDDVLSETNAAFDLYHNEKFGTSFKREDHFTFNLSIIWGVPQEECHKRVLDFNASEYFMNMEPLLGAREALLELSADHEIKVITSRLESFKDKTDQWLKKHYPEHKFDVFHANHYYGLSILKNFNSVKN